MNISCEKHILSEWISVTNFSLETFASHLVLSSAGPWNFIVCFIWPRLCGDLKLKSWRGCMQPLAMQNLQHLVKLLKQCLRRNMRKAMQTRPLFFCPSTVRGAALLLMSACSLPCSLEAALPKAAPVLKKEPPAEFTKAWGWKVQYWNFSHSLTYIHLTLFMTAGEMLVWLTLINFNLICLHLPTIWTTETNTF